MKPSAKNATAVVTELFESWYSAMVRFAARSVHSEELAEELVQEAFTELYKELRAGKRIEHPKAWTMRVIRRRVWREYAAPKPESLDVVPEPQTSSPMHQAELAMLLNCLTPRESDAILLRAAGLGYSEIAAEMGIATGTVSALLARALHRLREVAAASQQIRDAKP